MIFTVSFNSAICKSTGGGGQEGSQAGAGEAGWWGPRNGRQPTPR